MTIMAKVLKFIIIGLVAILVLWFSLDIQNLENHRANVSPARFNATDFAAQFWTESLPSCIAEAPQMTDVLQRLWMSRSFAILDTSRGHMNQEECLHTAHTVQKRGQVQN